VNITSYHGEVDPVSYHGVDAYRLKPQSSGHLRVHTVDAFQFPFSATWWIRPYEDMRPGGTSGGDNLDGLHTLFGHQDNDVNYNMHSVRRDVSLMVRNDHWSDDTIQLYADLPFDGPHSGHLGWRLDNLSVLFGGLTVVQR